MWCRSSFGHSLASCLGIKWKRQSSKSVQLKCELTTRDSSFQYPFSGANCARRVEFSYELQRSRFQLCSGLCTVYDTFICKRISNQPNILGWIAAVAILALTLRHLGFDAHLRCCWKPSTSRYCCKLLQASLRLAYQTSMAHESASLASKQWFFGLHCHCIRHQMVCPQFTA